MTASKIVDMAEVERWYEAGWTYHEMVEEYAKKYNLETTPSMFGNIRRKQGWPRRITRDDDLIPWHVKLEHRWNYDLTMLRAEARRRAGVVPLTEDAAERLASWLEMLEKNDAVVHYDPDTEEGFHLIKREPGDVDLIHQPKRKTTLHKRAD